jgi:sugar lactone lactonase YvrE
VSGLGIDTNGLNPRAVGAKWRAGAASMMNDVRFLGGHGTFEPDGARKEIYNNNQTADPRLERRWDGQYPSLWITDGGGGRFVSLWTPSPYAQAGLLVSDTTTPGRVYQVSSEHHVRSEVVLRNVANWAFYGLQTESERNEGRFALPLEIDGSRDVLFANLNIYRVMSSPQPYPQAIKVTRSSNIHFRNVHCYSGSKVSYDRLFHDATHDVSLWQRELGWLTLSGRAPARASRAPSPVLAPNAVVERLAGGFDNIAGGAVDGRGDFYFVDARQQRIHRWSKDAGLSTIRDNVLDPVNLVFDEAGHLMVLSFAGEGVVYSFAPNAPGQEVTRLVPQAAAPRPGLVAVLPANYYRTENDFEEDVVEKKPHHFVSPDGTTFLPAGDDFVKGEVRNRTKPHDVLRAFGLVKARPGQRFYVTEDFQQQTFSAAVGEDGTLTDLRLFAERGGDSLAVDSAGHVYLAAGQILVYDKDGRAIDTIEVPERPVQIAFGGSDGKTLFIAARTSLYAVRTRFAGR